MEEGSGKRFFYGMDASSKVKRAKHVDETIYQLDADLFKFFLNVWLIPFVYGMRKWTTDTDEEVRFKRK